MNEAYRVLKPGGIFYAITPYYPRAEVFVDPTHINFISHKTHTYFTTPNPGLLYMDLMENLILSKLRELNSPKGLIRITLHLLN